MFDEAETNRVYFCKNCRSPPPEGADLRSELRRSASWARYGSLVLVGVVLARAAHALGVVLGVPWLTWVVVGLSAFVAAVGVIAQKRAIRTIQESAVREFAPLGARLQCVGNPESIEGHGPIDDVPFEPQVFRAPLAMTLGADVGWILAILLHLMAFSECLERGHIKGAAIAAVLGIVFLGLLCRPVYLRVVPGKMIVLRFSWLRRGTRSVVEHCLRHAEVVADLGKNLVHVRNKGESATYEIALMREKNQFIHSLFLAAVSTYEPPTPATDEL